MDFEGKYNVKSPAVKRLMREACELKESTEEYWAHPLDDNLFEWHFTVQGPPATDFEGGVYHGRILLPAEYPMKPPNIILLTPNGRFETNKKICLSISGHHPETWQPSWSIRTALMALIAFMPTPGNGTIGSLDYTKEERQTLARRSQSWECSTCGKIILQLSTATSKPLTHEESALISQIALKAEELRTDNKEAESTEANSETQTTETTNVDEHDSELRQRVTGRVNPADNSPIGVPQIQLPTAVDSSTGDMKNIAMWFLICAIGFLIYRRLFLV